MNDDIITDYEHYYDHINISINIIISRDDGILIMIL